MVSHFSLNKRQVEIIWLKAALLDMLAQLGAQVQQQKYHRAPAQSFAQNAWLKSFVSQRMHNSDNKY